MARSQKYIDVGSGQGHWGLTLLPFLDEKATLTGIEPEVKWRDMAAERAEQFGSG